MFIHNTPENPPKQEQIIIIKSPVTKDLEEQFEWAKANYKQDEVLMCVYCEDGLVFLVRKK
jgi:hypothetical protein